MGEDAVSLRSNLKGGGYGLFAVIDKAAGDLGCGEMLTKLQVASVVARGLEVSHFMMVTRNHTINGLRNRDRPSRALRRTRPVYQSMEYIA